MSTRSGGTTGNPTMKQRAREAASTALLEAAEHVAAERGVDLAAQLGPQSAPAGQQAMIQGMVDRLAAQLKAQPRDLDGWIRLMRSRMVLGDPASASGALRDGLAAFSHSAPVQTKLRDAAKAMGVSGA